MMEVGTPRQFLWLKWVFALIFILNALDGVLTVAWVLSGQAEEANPMMDHLIEVNPVVFMAVKLTLVALGSFLLWRLRRIPSVVVTIFLLFIVYYAILVYHAQAFADIVFPQETIEESVPRPEQLNKRFHRRS